MAETTLSTIRTILENVVEETHDPEIKFKLRSALQLLTVIEEQQAGARETLMSADLTEEVRENLDELGYLG
ncbi:MAG: hypothetical protein ABEJ48_06565 [Halobacteriales archaeon]